MAITDCNFEQLQIDQKYISLFASGLSINDMTDEEFAYLKENTYMIGTNYFLLYYIPHLVVFSDINTMSWYEKLLKIRDKNFLIMSREDAFDDITKTQFKTEIDYWFNVSEYKLRSNYTAVWIIQLVRKFFPDKQLLLFGFDFYIPDNIEKKTVMQHDKEKGDKIVCLAKVKCYDHKTDYDMKERIPGKYKGQLNKFEKDLQDCKKEINDFTINVWNCNPMSRTNVFRKKVYRDVLEIKKMRILHLCNTALAGAPTHLSKIINKYTEHESITVLSKYFTHNSLDKLKWDFDFVTPEEAELNKLIEISDIIHYHNKPDYLGKTFNKPNIIQFHSQPEHHPNNYEPGETYKEFNGRKLVIAQYHPRFYTDAKIIPNMIDIWDDMYTGKHDNTRLRIFFGYAWTADGWSYKGVEEIADVLDKFRDRCDVQIISNKPYDEMMEIKRYSDIVIGDCFTGSYHLADLEGAAVGAVVFNNIDSKTHACLREISHNEISPFVRADITTLPTLIEEYITDHNKRITQMKKARQWMENYWDPSKLVKLFIEQYKEVLNNC